MFPSEMVILMAISVNKNTSKELLNRPVDIAGEYIGYLYDSLVSRGFITGNRSKGYQLTSMGRQSLSGFLRKNETRAADTVKRLEQLGISCNQKMGKIGREVIEVK